MIKKYIKNNPLFMAPVIAFPLLIAFVCSEPFFEGKILMISFLSFSLIATLVAGYIDAKRKFDD